LENLSAQKNFPLFYGQTLNFTQIIHFLNYPIGNEN